jgi:hypothetical protein
VPAAPLVEVPGSVVVDGEVCALAGPAGQANRVTRNATTTDSAMARFLPAMRMSCLLSSTDTQERKQEEGV